MASRLNTSISRFLCSETCLKLYDNWDFKTVTQCRGREEWLTADETRLDWHPLKHGGQLFFFLYVFMNLASLISEEKTKSILPFSFSSSAPIVFSLSSTASSSEKTKCFCLQNIWGLERRDSSSAKKTLQMPQIPNWNNQGLCSFKCVSYPITIDWHSSSVGFDQRWILLLVTQSSP